ncbi:MAG: helix-turn-helix domain-containing protein, partial [Chryseobacterium sp.]
KTLMDYMKSFECPKKRFTFQIPLTRQQMANLTGLCVETVIRTLKKMERDGKLLIENGKILY